MPRTGALRPPAMTKFDPFKYLHSSPAIIRLAVMLYVRFPLSLRKLEDILHERGVEVSHETVHFWWNKFARCSPPRSESAVSRAGYLATNIRRDIRDNQRRLSLPLGGWTKRVTVDAPSWVRSQSRLHQVGFEVEVQHNKINVLGSGEGSTPDPPAPPPTFVSYSHVQTARNSLGIPSACMFANAEETDSGGWFGAVSCLGLTRLFCRVRFRRFP